MMWVVLPALDMKSLPHSPHRRVARLKRLLCNGDGDLSDEGDDDDDDDDGGGDDDDDDDEDVDVVVGVVLCKSECCL